MNNVETTRRIMQAFLAGDIPAILERLSPAVEWEYGVISTDVPWYQKACRMPCACRGHPHAGPHAVDTHQAWLAYHGRQKP